MLIRSDGIALLHRWWKEPMEDFADAVKLLSRIDRRLQRERILRNLDEQLPKIPSLQEQLRWQVRGLNFCQIALLVVAILQAIILWRTW